MEIAANKKKRNQNIQWETEQWIRAEWANKTKAVNGLSECIPNNDDDDSANVLVSRRCYGNAADRPTNRPNMNGEFMVFIAIAKRKTVLNNHVTVP